MCRVFRAHQHVFQRHQQQSKDSSKQPGHSFYSTRATETDDDNDEAASNAEAINSATAERSNTHNMIRIKEEYIPDDIENTHHFPHARNKLPQTGLFDESDVDNDDNDDDYSVRDDDDCKIPAATRPKSTKKQQFDDSDDPAFFPDASPAKRMRSQTRKQPEIRYNTRQFARQRSGTQQINFVGHADLRKTKKKVRNPSGAPRPAKQAFPHENRSVQSRDIADQSDTMADSHFPIPNHDQNCGDLDQQLPRVLDLGHLGPRAKLPMTFLLQLYDFLQYCTCDIWQPICSYFSP
jgi:hypothetical protein